MKKISIKINSSTNPNSWYRNKIGKTLTIDSKIFFDHSDKFYAIKGRLVNSLIHKCDCEILIA